MTETLLPKTLYQASSLKDGLMQLRDHLMPMGVRDLVYGFMLRDRSFVRNDLVFVYTLADSLMDIYYQGGGLNNDPHASDMGAMKEPVSVLLKDIEYRDIGGRKVQLPFASAAIKDGYTRMLTCPGSVEDTIGIAGLSFYQESRVPAPNIDSGIAQAITIAFHKTMRTHKQLAGWFGLTDPEKEALAAMTEGRTAKDYAASLNVTPRTVEMRLQSIRQKLKAKTTVEAAYKAVAYGILPL